MTAQDRPLCRCGVYADIHPTKTCVTPRHSFWWHRHYLGRHIRCALWLRLSDKQRWDLAGRYYDRHPELCWCDMVDAVIAADADRRADYEDPCDAPLLRDAKVPTGNCYCFVERVAA